MVNIAIFASGGGSNANEIIKYFTKHPKISVALIVSNNPKAGVLEISAQNKIDTKLIHKEDLKECDNLIASLIQKEIQLIVLAGFLWHIPSKLIQAFPDRILNIHPSLLPKYGGKGMYGHYVHEAVKTNNEKYSGMTIHKVNAYYDEGDIIFQKSIEISQDMNADDIASSVLKLEHTYYPSIIENYINSEFS
jgi:phosphoribosylglycinamide formyltransferase-1